MANVGTFEPGLPKTFYPGSSYGYPQSDQNSSTGMVYGNTYNKYGTVGAYTHVEGTESISDQSGWPETYMPPTGHHSTSVFQAPIHEISDYAHRAGNDGGSESIRGRPSSSGQKDRADRLDLPSPELRYDVNSNIYLGRIQNALGSDGIADRDPELYDLAEKASRSGKGRVFTYLYKKGYSYRCPKSACKRLLLRCDRRQENRCQTCETTVTQAVSGESRKQ